MQCVRIRMITSRLRCAGERAAIGHAAVDVDALVVELLLLLLLARWTVDSESDAERSAKPLRTDAWMHVAAM
jgi:hypothetical protein